jgi:hypothetical protein
LTNVLDFLNQEVVIITGPYFSYPEGVTDIREKSHIITDNDLYEEWCSVFDKFESINREDCYHLIGLDSYVTIVANNRRCIFTNKDMKGGGIFGTIFWIENYSELLKTFKDKDLKKISKAIIHPHYYRSNVNHQTSEVLDLEFFFSLKFYQPKIIFKYSIDTFMSNICWDVYKKLESVNLNYIVDKYIPNYKACDNCKVGNILNCNNTDLCKCGRLRTLCYLDL